MVVISSINASLGSTARWTAAARAYESEREDHLFEDPWASKLAGIEGAAWAATRTPDSLAPMILRIRYFDDFLQRVTREDAIHQVVLMAAGYDTRAYRLTWPAGTIVFELDHLQFCVIKKGFFIPPERDPTANGRPSKLT